MPSLLPGFEYDIFISYRHNDNRSGWVTEFVKALQEELASTIKDPVSVYFDTNPHDGLLETHNVDKSLAGKLKCLIFIPIISQTYCDPKSFAWQHEFIAYNKMATEDQFGRDIKLGSGNVASRILPVKINELDAEDNRLLETELGGVLRAIEFIFKSSGINRPLNAKDDEVRAPGKILYRDQVNKVANAIKEVTFSLKTPTIAAAHATGHTPGNNSSRSRSKGLLIVLLIILSLTGYFIYTKFGRPGHENDSSDKSIAVLPFTDMSPAKDQEYLGDGIAEDIITALSKIKELKVIGRTSSFQFKGEKVDLREVGARLNVSTVLEGSIMKSGNKIRITAQLVNVNDGSHIWSERYDQPMDDIFSVQDEISRMISNRMRVTLAAQNDSEAKPPTTNMEAYENLLKGNYFLSYGPEKAKVAKPLFEKAIQLDSNYADAYEGLASVYFFLPFIGEISSGEAIEKMTALLNKLLALDPSSKKAHGLLFNMNFYYVWNWEKAQEEYKMMNHPAIGYAFFRQNLYNDTGGAIQEMLKVLENNPLNKDALRILADFYTINQEFSKANRVLQQAIELDPAYASAYLVLGYLQLAEQKYEMAEASFKKCEGLTPGLTWGRAGHIKALVMGGKMKEARALYQSMDLNKLPPGTMADMCFSLGNLDEGFAWLDKAFLAKETYCLALRSRSYSKGVTSDPRYEAMIKKMNFPK